MRLNRNKIMLLLAKKQITQKKLANIAKVAYLTIEKGYEKEISPASVGKIAAALGVPVEEIILTEEE